MIIVDDKGNLFDDRRKGDRRKKDTPVDVERRKDQRRINTENKRHDAQQEPNEAEKNDNE